MPGDKRPCSAPNPLKSGRKIDAYRAYKPYGLRGAVLVNDAVKMVTHDSPRLHAMGKGLK